MFNLYVPLSDVKLKDLKSETYNNSELSLLKEYIIKQYHTFREQLYIFNGLVIRYNYVIKPQNLRNIMLGTNTFKHLELEKCKARARLSIFWPRMSKYIENKNNHCNICDRFR